LIRISLRGRKKRKADSGRDSEARNLSGEERKMTAIMRQIEEMEQPEKAVKDGPCLT
jgi:ABC-type branched-subunit amino acid transport system ATPase component